MSPQIYALVDPRTDEIRYVGQTCTSLKSRLAGHISRSKKLRVHRDCWIANVLADNLRPEIVELESGDWSRDELNEREIYWIARLRADGVRLTNHSDGGQGPTGNVFTNEARQRLSDAARASWSDPAWREWRTKAMREVWEVQEVRNVISQQSKERWSSPDYKARVTLQSSDYKTRRSAIAVEIASRRRQCLDCNYIGNPMNMGRHLNFYSHSGFVDVQIVEA